MHLVYRINKGLGILLPEMFHHLEPTRVREDGCDQSYSFLSVKVAADQLFPG